MAKIDNKPVEQCICGAFAHDDITHSLECLMRSYHQTAHVTIQVIRPSEMGPMRGRRAKVVIIDDVGTSNV
ncbi:hypothetical protein [Parvimonas sp. M13]|uniref:hypothetical protein n=1 Tax=Parvimonas sp. M13 TaxID=3110694 RepID=UPI002B46D9F0|nr:hypothetical protein [Parvimonas sp. M13]MEB3025851.1 hypothetical protein [Parvimonas sp. M13]